ncbi:uncharacterized protein LOC111110367 [Crassostrea virginica]
MNSSGVTNGSNYEGSLELHGRFWNSAPIIGGVTVVFNIIAIMMISKSKTIAQNLKVYISSLMVCDCLTGLNLTVTPIIHWLVDVPELVDVSVAIIRTLLLISILHTAGLSMDRLVSVKFPHLYALYVSRKVCILFCVCIWLLLTVFQIVVSLLTTNDPMGGQFDKTVYIIFLTLYFSCLLVYLISSRTIIQCARNHLKRLNVSRFQEQQQHGQQQGQQQGQQPVREQKVTATFRLSIVITTASGCLFALYLPVQVFIILTFIDPTRTLRVTQVFSDVSYPLLMLESLINPVLYLARFRESRKTIKQFFCPSGNDRENLSRDVVTLRTFNAS